MNLTDQKKVVRIEKKHYEKSKRQQELKDVLIQTIKVTDKLKKQLEIMADKGILGATAVNLQSVSKGGTVAN